ncbi:7993_t:CDS:1, partial [Paraglomus occultum]
GKDLVKYGQNKGPNTSSSNTGSSNNDIIINLPNKNDTQIRCANHVVECARRLIQIMRDTTINPLFEHPPDPTDGNYRGRFKDLAKDIQHPPPDTRTQIINTWIFEAGYCVTKDENKESWDNFSDFKRGCMAYYQLIRLIISCIIDESSWRMQIKEELFNMNVFLSYFRDMGIKKNWPYLQVSIQRLCDLS